MDVRTLEPRATSEPCQAHRSHRPQPMYCELHHVVPVSWQQSWTPESPAPDATPGNYDGYRLWDTRRVPLCPTGHRNVHWWIVRLMRAVHEADSEELAAPLVRGVFGSSRANHEQQIALLGLHRWQENGGALLQLTATGHWGQA